MKPQHPPPPDFADKIPHPCPVTTTNSPPSTKLRRRQDFISDPPDLAAALPVASTVFHNQHFDLVLELKIRFRSSTKSDEIHPTFDLIPPLRRRFDPAAITPTSIRPRRLLSAPSSLLHLRLPSFPLSSNLDVFPSLPQLDCSRLQLKLSPCLHPT